jgi:putative transcriptional regulator
LGKVFPAVVQILRNKNLATKFQILVEVAANQPNLQQRDIAKKLDVTSQAISEYIKELVKDGWLVTDGRSRYRVTKEGTNWVLKTFRDLRDYSAFVGKAINNITVCTAVAGYDLSQGQVVGLEMKDGILYATEDTGKQAKGRVVTAAKKGEDVGVSDIQGIVELVMGKITILRVPGIQRGGSGRVDLDRLEKEATSRKKPLGAIGIEAITALRRIGIEPRYLYGVAEAAIEAARSGLSFVIVCTEEDAPQLLAQVTGANLDYEILDLRES